VTDKVRDAMLQLCSSLLAKKGLFYLNYNTHPEWTIRGLVRDYLLQQTVTSTSLKERVERCREISASVIGPLNALKQSLRKLSTSAWYTTTETLK
jgi:hypothetical protein